MTFVDTGEADPSHAALAGTTFKLPPEYTSPPAGSPGSGPNNPGILGTEQVRGYLRTEANGSKSWVMTGEINAQQKAAILGVPGGLGWVDQSMGVGTPLRITMNVAKALRQAGLAGPDVLDVLTKLVRAGANNRDAQIVAGG